MSSNKGDDQFTDDPFTNDQFTDDQFTDDQFTDDQFTRCTHTCNIICLEYANNMSCLKNCVAHAQMRLVLCM